MPADRRQIEIEIRVLEHGRDGDVAPPEIFPGSVEGHSSPPNTSISVIRQSYPGKKNAKFSLRNSYAGFKEV
jgi:hypothetical protein